MRSYKMSQNDFNDMPDGDLTGALRGVGEFKAPPGLLAEVMLRVQTRSGEHGAKARGYDAWPKPLRCGFLAVGTLLVLSVAVGLHGLREWILPSAPLDSLALGAAQTSDLLQTGFYRLLGAMREARFPWLLITASLGCGYLALLMSLTVLLRVGRLRTTS